MSYDSSGRIAGVRPANGSSDVVTVTYDASSRVATLTRNSQTWSYAYVDSGSTRTTTVTDPLSHQRVVVGDLTTSLISSDTDENGNAKSYAYDSAGRVTSVTMPEGNATTIAYDARGNATSQTYTPKSGSGLSAIATYASFDITCSNDKTCNQPNTTTDANGNVTDYTYDSTHGGVLTVTLPAPTTGAIRPQTRYSYSGLYAWYKNSSGTIVQAPSPIYRLAGTSTCVAGSSCSGTANETASTIAYQTGGTGVASNLLPTAVTTAAGDNSVTATRGFSYDDIGNITAVDGPLSGSGDTTAYRYDADRRRVGTISPDPDGAGALYNRATKVTYDADGNATVVEIGTTTGQTSTDWAAFASLQQVTSTYDPEDRKTKVVTTAGGTTFQVVQYSYDAIGRPECTALRMNSAAWGSLPSSACSLATTGGYGPDRITKTTYDPAGQATQVQTAYGTGDQANEATGTYNYNGTLATLADAEGNKTSYSYDGLDRLSQTFYPITTAGAGTSSTTDYEQLSYDAAGHVTSRRIRDGNSIGYSYDADGRLTYKDLPTGENDVTYTYDLLGRVTSAATGAQTLTFGYDALSRLTSQGGPLGTVSTQYDAAGRRTRLTWPDSFYVTYDYLATGEVSAIRENGASSGIGVLATYVYDDLGRRTSLTRGNGTSSTFGYDNASRLTSLGLDLDGAATTNDLSLGFSYSPASQIAGTTRSNNVYAWGGAANRNDASSVNGLNQVISVGAGSIGYDTKGNLNSTGTNSYTYSSENLLLTGPSSATLDYDPLLRLYQESGSSTAVRFQYDSQAMLGEYDTLGVIQKRYIMGPGADEALVEYDKSGSSYVRVWFYADERGSIIAQSNDGGAMTAINSYDEFGVPASGNVGRFQYTGQAWVPTLGMYNYKARFYSSRLGRFMQTDLLEYSDGINWYNYTRGDPINYTDSLGTWSCYPGTVPALVPSSHPSGTKDKDGYYIVNGPHTVCIAVGISPNGGFGGMRIVGIPHSTAQACAYRGMSGTCVGDIDENGHYVVSKQQQPRDCRNYAAFQDSAAIINDSLTVDNAVAGGSGGALAVRIAGNPIPKWAGGAIIGAMATFSGVTANATTGQGFRPHGITVIPKIAPPSYCR